MNRETIDMITVYARDTSDRSLYARPFSYTYAHYTQQICVSKMFL